MVTLLVIRRYWSFVAVYWKLVWILWIHSHVQSCCFLFFVLTQRTVPCRRTFLVVDGFLRAELMLVGFGWHYMLDVCLQVLFGVDGRFLWENVFLLPSEADSISRKEVSVINHPSVLCIDRRSWTSLSDRYIILPKLGLPPNRRLPECLVVVYAWFSFHGSDLDSLSTYEATAPFAASSLALIWSPLPLELLVDVLQLLSDDSLLLL